MDSLPAQFAFDCLPLGKAQLDVKSLVPAPMREETNGSAQPLDLAWTTLMLSVANVVPAPRLELGTP